MQAAGDLSSEGAVCAGGLGPARSVTPLHVAYPSLCSLDISPRASVLPHAWAAVDSNTSAPDRPTPRSSHPVSSTAGLEAQDCPIDIHRTKLPRATSSTDYAGSSASDSEIDVEPPTAATSLGKGNRNHRRVHFAEEPVKVVLFTVESQLGNSNLRPVRSRSSKRGTLGGRGGHMLDLHLQRCVRQAAALSAQSFGPHSPRIREVY